MAFNPFVSVSNMEFHVQFWHRSRIPTLQEAETLLRQGAGNGKPDFISWFKQKVMSTSWLFRSMILQVARTCT